VSGWDWEAAARGLGARRDGGFNAGAIPLTQRCAVIWERADGSCEQIPGAQLHRRAERIARALAALGIQPRDRVAGLLGRRPEAFALPLAVWRLGAIYVPLFSGFGVDAIAVRLRDSGTRVLVADDGNLTTAATARERMTELTVVSVVDPDARADADIGALSRSVTATPEISATKLGDPATIMYTSGTTGTPKGCVIPHRGIVSLLPYVVHCLRLTRGEVLFSTADTGWSFGLYTTGLVPLAHGATRLLYEPSFEARGWWSAARRHSASHLASAPTGFRQLAAAGQSAVGEGGLPVRDATSAGEPLTPEVLAWFREQLDVTIHDSYGLTELGMLLANLRGSGELEPWPGSMGVEVPGFALRVVDVDNRQVPEGEVGRLAVRDDGWFLGSTYWNREPEWDARRRDGWWLTEDLARRDRDGRHWYVARADDVIVTAGYNVGPAEVEAALLEHPLVRDVACVGVPDMRKGQVIAAHLVLAGDAVEPGTLLDTLRPWVGERIGWHAAPRHVYLYDELPRTESGKLVRRRLRERADSAESGRG
jgi:acetyl-CoA synthetase